MPWQNASSPPTEAPLFSNTSRPTVNYGTTGALAISNTLQPIANYGTTGALAISNTSQPTANFAATGAPVISNTSGALHYGQEISQITEQNGHFGPTLNGFIEMAPNVEHSLAGQKRKKLKEVNRSRATENVTSVPPLNRDTEINHPNVESKKDRAPKSDVWKWFKKTKTDKEVWATCSQCEKRFDGSSKKGTTHLRNHIQSCLKKKNPVGSGGADKSADKSSSTSSVVIKGKGKSKVDQELNHQLDETRIFIKHFGSSIESKKDAILEVFKEEKEKLRRHFEKLPCRFNLSMAWLHEYDCGEFYVSVHFIDDNWELKKKVIYVDKTYYYDRDLCKKLKCMLKDWSIDKYICSVTTLPGGADELEEYEEMKEWISDRCSLPLAQTFLLPLYRLVDKLLEWWGLQTLMIMDKILSLKEYVSNVDNKKKFEEAVDKAAAAKSLSMPINADPRSLSDFELLAWCVGLKGAFKELEKIDPISFHLTEAEWEQSTAIYKFSKEMKVVANSFSDNKYTTPNVYFPKFCHLYRTSLQWQKSDLDCFRQIASELREYVFDDYWTDYKSVLTTTIILDPRFKLGIVELWFREIYDNHDIDRHMREVIDEVTNIYNQYAKANIERSNMSTMLDPMGRPCTSVHHVDDRASNRSELARYLEDPKFPAIEEFDILAWWRVNVPIYPTLARMARDYLAIPLCVENKFDPSLRDEISNIFYSKCLDDDAVEIKEALMLTKIWLYGS